MSVTPSPSVGVLRGHDAAERAKIAQRHPLPSGSSATARSPPNAQRNCSQFYYGPAPSKVPNLRLPFLALRQLPCFAGSIRPDLSNFQAPRFLIPAPLRAFLAVQCRARLTGAGLGHGTARRPPACRGGGPGGGSPALAARQAIMGPPGRHSR